MATIKLKGDTSGEIIIQAPAVAGTNTLTLDATTGTILNSNSSIPASSLTGSLPALDASSLTNIPAANLTGSLPAGMGGKVLQVVHNNVDTRATYSAPNNNVGTTMTALNTTITPTSSSSKIIIMWSMHYESIQDVLFRLFRNTTEIGRNSGSSGRWSGLASAYYDPDTATTPSRLTFNYVDLPATTSALTYSLKTQSSNANSYTTTLNRPVSGTNTGQDSYELGTSSVILIEVGA